MRRERDSARILKQSAKWLFLATRIPGCPEPRKCKDCHAYVVPERWRKVDRRCKDCSRLNGKRNRKRLKVRNPERYRMLKRAAKHRRQALKRGNGGAYTAAQWLAVLKRFKYLCAHCHRPGKMTVDHVIPLSLGGHNDWTNLQPLCHPCNSLKGATLTGAVQMTLPGIG
jgi:5-methylcytosine-specific restriction endonuclease McrA